MKRILILSDYSRDPDRRILKGLVQYANEKGGWALFQVNPALRERREDAGEICRLARLYKVDAVYGKWPGIDGRKARALGIPIILRSHRKSRDGFRYLAGEYRRMGAMAADFFIERQFRSFAFFGLEGIVWSSERCQGFKKRLQEVFGKDMAPLQFSSLEVEDREKEGARIGSWLENLPKPCALFACNDLHAQFIAQACQVGGIKVPEEISILGADNDDFLCNLSFPTLSSININYESAGYRLGSELEREIDGRKGKFDLALEPDEIIERNSTREPTIRDPYVAEILGRMKEHFTEDIGIGEIVAGIPLSRRSLEMRFRTALYPMTMLQYLNELRIKRFSYLLRTTSLPVGEAAAASGFINPENAFPIFRKRFGCSPLQYRKKVAVTASARLP